jgi:hypothetical protein
MWSNLLITELLTEDRATVRIVKTALIEDPAKRAVCLSVVELGSGLGRPGCAKAILDFEQARQLWQDLGDALFDRPTKEELRMSDSTLERFGRYVEIGEAEDACWIWTGPLVSDRYPCFSGRLAGERRAKGGRSAARASYQHHVGPIGVGEIVQQGCGESLCVNPDHLYLARRSSLQKKKKPTDDNP